MGNIGGEENKAILNSGGAFSIALHVLFSWFNFFLNKLYRDYTVLKKTTLQVVTGKGVLGVEDLGLLSYHF